MIWWRIRFFLIKLLNFKSIDSGDEHFWNQFWSDNITSIQDIFTLIPAVEIRALREEAPSNLSTLCFKVVEKLKECSENSYLTEKNRFIGKKN